MAKYGAIEKAAHYVNWAISEKDSYIILGEDTAKNKAVAKQRICWSLQCRRLPRFLFQYVLCKTRKNTTRQNLICWKRTFVALSSSLCRNTYCCHNFCSITYKFGSERTVKRTFEDTEVGPMAKYWKLLEQTENVTSLNRRFWKKNNGVVS